LRFGTIPDADHCDDCGDANNDPKRSENRAHFVSAQRTEGNIKC
jgi:hypothetical protein